MSENQAMEQIMVGIDGSSSAGAALRWALQESTLRSGSVTAVMVWDYLDQHHTDSSTEFDPAYDAVAAEAALKRFITTAVGETNGGQVGTEVVCDLVARGLVRASKDASLLVLGARGRGGFAELLLGSVSQRCLHKASCAVAIVRSPPAENTREHGRIVAGVDGSADGQAALRWAAQEAAHRDAQLRVVHAAQPTQSTYFDLPLPDPVRAVDVANREANAILEHAISQLNPSSVKVEAVPATGSPAKALLNACEEADLVVIGRAGHSALRSRLVGSVATQISHHSKVPAVFVNSQDAP
ncbi:MAG: universal stress protein [Acidimicrobiia bacterium]